MDILSLIISLVSGAVGGNVAGAAMPDKTLGGIGNTVAGLIGGGAGEFILKALGVLATSTAATGGSLDISSILASIGVSGVSGAAITAVVALLKDAMQKK